MARLGFGSANLTSALAGSTGGAIQGVQLQNEKARLEQEQQRQKNEDTLKLATALSAAGNTREAAQLINTRKVELGLDKLPGDEEGKPFNIVDFDVNAGKGAYSMMQLDDGSVVKIHSKTGEVTKELGGKKFPSPAGAAKTITNLKDKLLVESRNMKSALAYFGEGSELSVTGDSVQDFARAMASFGKSDAFVKARDAAANPEHPDYQKAVAVLTELDAIRANMAREVRGLFNISEEKFEAEVDRRMEAGIDKEFGKPITELPVGGKGSTKGASLQGSATPKGWPPGSTQAELDSFVAAHEAELGGKPAPGMQSRYLAWVMAYFDSYELGRPEDKLDKALRAAERKIGLK